MILFFLQFWEVWQIWEESWKQYFTKIFFWKQFRARRSRERRGILNMIQKIWFRHCADSRKRRVAAYEISEGRKEPYSLSLIHIWMSFPVRAIPQRSAVRFWLPIRIQAAVWDVQSPKPLKRLPHRRTVVMYWVPFSIRLFFISLLLD